MLMRQECTEWRMLGWPRCPLAASAPADGNANRSRGIAERFIAKYTLVGRHILDLEAAPVRRL